MLGQCIQNVSNNTVQEIRHVNTPAVECKHVPTFSAFALYYFY